MKDSYSQAEMHYNDCAAPPIFAFFAWMYPSATFLKVQKNMIIGCKLATTEYGAETFFQSQLVYTD